MNIASVAPTSQVQTQDAISIVMLRKALDQQRASAAQLIAALPQPVSAPYPTATVGRNVDTFA